MYICTHTQFISLMFYGESSDLVTIKRIYHSQIVYLTDYLERYHHIYSIDLFKNNTKVSIKNYYEFSSFYTDSVVFSSKQTNKNVCNPSTVRNKASLFHIGKTKYIYNIYIKFLPFL